MIKFFRQIRQNLIIENKTTNYLKYALGEIVLVVVGILIALQVNNWNESRKQNETLNTIYTITKEDLINDISKIDSFVKEFEEKRKPAFEAVLNTNPSKEDFLKNPQYLSVFSGYKDFDINQRGFELLKNQSNLTITLEQNMASKINFFYDQHIVEINIAIDELSQDFTNNNDYFKNYGWFSSYMLGGEMDSTIDYILNNPIAKNRITYYYILFTIYVEELSKFRSNAKQLIIQIDNHLEEN